MHCVGMCGPLAIWASGTSDRRLEAGGDSQAPSRQQMLMATTLYHLGRLFTYAIVGVLAGIAGSLMDYGGETLGVQLIAARLVGTTMIVLGTLRLISILGFTSPKPATNRKPSAISRVLVRLRPHVFRLPLLSKAFATGLLTAFLPCGWLYLFALVAAGTGSMVTGPLVMIAFWMGTVPALVSLVAGTRILAVRYGKLVPAVASTLFIMAGCYTAAGRGFSQLNSLTEIHSASLLAQPSEVASGRKLNPQSVDVAQELKVLVATPLPCCVEKSDVVSAMPGGSQ